MALRFSRPGLPWAGFAEPGKGWTGKAALIPSALDWPLHRRKPLTIFVCSKSDLFHEGLPFAEAAKVFERMCWAFRLVCRKADACRCECDHDSEGYDPDNGGCHCWAEIPAHDYVILTKRAARMREFFEWLAAEAPGGRTNAEVYAPSVAYTMAEADWPLPNVWLGVSVENQEAADERIPPLLETPAAHRWISAEPMLGPIDLRLMSRSYGFPAHITAEGHAVGMPQGIHQVVTGGESGSLARPCDVSWIRSIRDQCKAANVPLYCKQVGAHAIDVARIYAEPSLPGDIISGDATPEQLDRLGDLIEKGIVRLRDRAGANPAEWPEDLRCRELAWPLHKEER
jgi:protein gp37